MHCENLDLTLQKTSTMMHSRICTSFIVDISTYIFPQYGIVVEKFILAQYKLRPHTLYNKIFAMMGALVPTTYVSANDANKIHTSYRVSHKEMN